MTKTNKDKEPEQLDFFFWLGEDGELEKTTEKEFKQRQKDWKGDRPSDYSTVETD